ncbi:MAG: aldehyde ferredoxin oxidoreductase family protein [Candidatus Desulfofervidaceae bacterium]|nr:aldehyde ferredoxin oxidoreductase family protein [Candidatus Desulfofervidaceae bacterium]MDL1969827.1 aldehyde ferredoxin oxidoreductase family protein [Candidatus Desulfofervidaceae bacterium]
MLNHDPLQRVLYIDLTRRSFRIEHRPDLFERYLGGAGVASALLLEECPEGADPLEPENPIIFAVGPLVGLFPMASKTVAMFKSPHTGNLGESHAGGRSAVSIRMAGYGAIVIKGASDIPVYLTIFNDKVQFHDGRALWGMRSDFAARATREKESGSGMRTIMRIGLAGERLVSYACVITETYRHFGRLGLGAVFGSKKLKAIVISGKSSLPVVDRKTYKKAYNDIFQQLLTKPSLKKYHDLGTSLNILPLNKICALPTRNLQKACFEQAEEISGEHLAENYLGRRIACTHCPIACIHLAALREPYKDEPYFYKTTFISYDYELIYALGTMLGIGNSRGLMYLLNEVEILGLDAISTGVVLAWVTEAFQKGLITEKETMGLKPAWGDYETYVEIMKKIVLQPNEFYQAVAKGAEYASELYGGKEFALAFGKNEMPGYHTGYGGHLTFLTGARHSHLDSAGYSFDQKFLGKEVPPPEDYANHLFAEESYRQIISSLVICFFARGVYNYPTIERLLKIAGFDFSEESLKGLGEEILKQKYRFKFREGFSLDQLRIPKRILETISPHGRLQEEFIRKAIAAYKRLLS